MRSVLLSLACLGGVLSDTPAKCMVKQIYGKWTFFVGKTTNKYLKYDPYKEITNGNVQKRMVVEFSKPDVVRVINPANSENGHFTMIYGEGFEATIALNRYFAYNYFTGSVRDRSHATYDCKKTMTGYAQDVLGHSHRPFVAYKGEHPKIPKHSKKGLAAETKVGEPVLELGSSSTSWADKKYKKDNDLVDRINNLAGNTWTASEYPDIWSEELTLGDVAKMSGVTAGFGNDMMDESADAEKSKKLKFKSKVNKQDDRTVAESTFAYSSFNANIPDKDIPPSYDWRNVNGVNYVSAVEHQRRCGSCYVFAAKGMIESRIRIATNNTVRPILSAQQALDCSSYAQGCSGGWPFLTGGKYANEFGFVEESCYRYQAKDRPCRDAGFIKYMKPAQRKLVEKADWKHDCTNRYYAAHYRYIGGYYGNDDADSMKKELFKHGPIVIGMNVHDDFRYYSSGVYKHTRLSSKFNHIAHGFRKVTHAMLIVGYGTDVTENGKSDYWITKNSWGPYWGDNGYIKIRRGVDDSNIESVAVAAYPIVPQ